MFRASIGGGAAARVAVYRHGLVRFIIPALGPLAGGGAGGGWSALNLTLCSILMSWDPAPTLAQRFESALAVLDAALPRRRRAGRTFQGLAKALSRRGDGVLSVLCDHLRTLSEHAAGRRWRLGRGADALVPIGVDGSRFDAPRTVGNEALGITGRDKSGPQIAALLLVHLGSMLPLAYELGGAHQSERALLRRVLGLLPRRTLLVADAGFTGYELLRELAARRTHFLIRVGGNVRLLRELGLYRREGKHTVYLWPDSRRADAPLVLRLIRVGSVYLISDITDPRVLSAKAAAELYRRRWGLEVAFRSLKQTLGRRKVRSGAAGNALAELAWSIAGLWTLMLLGARALAAAGHAPSALSLAAALAAVRAAARAPGLGDRVLSGRLRRAVVDTGPRRAPKRAYRWPHKKNPPPPGAPTITTATAAQVRQAKALRSRKPAA